MSDELDDAVRRNAQIIEVAQEVAQREQKALRDQQAAEALQWLQALLRVALIGYGAWLWWGWRGCIGALAVYLLAERAVVWVGQLILCAKARG